ncbi:hypothetical protein [Algoriphagus aquimarinus]|uniref:hypothetical protein n=1 Tax=Algoriphagus aquimarinus TaxID=237018 RepID=UPI0030D89B9A
MESHYQVSTKRELTDFAGLSMVGIQAFNIGLFHPEKFGYVFPLSTGYFPGQLKMLEEKYAQTLKNPEINSLKLFWITMGREQDIAYQNGKNTLPFWISMG